MPSIGLPSARAEASRRNGAKSRGPKTAEGKARSARNALKHGLRAQKHVVLPSEDAAEFKALEAALIEELAPEGVLQSVLAQRVVAATWRLARAERIEAELFAREMQSPFGGRDSDLGLALIRDCNGARAFDTLLRYRGGTLAELWRALRTLKALQAEAAARPAIPDEAPAPAPLQNPDEPEARVIPGEAGRASDPADAAMGDPGAALPWRPSALPTPGGSTPCVQPIEPETRRKPPALSIPSEIVDEVASLLAGTALVPLGRRKT